MEALIMLENSFKSSSSGPTASTFKSLSLVDIRNMLSVISHTVRFVRADGTHSGFLFLFVSFFESLRLLSLFLLKVQYIVDGLHVTEDEHLILRSEPADVAEQVVGHLVMVKQILIISGETTNRTFLLSWNIIINSRISIIIRVWGFYGPLI